MANDIVRFTYWSGRQLVLTPAQVAQCTDILLNALCKAQPNARCLGVTISDAKAILAEQCGIPGLSKMVDAERFVEFLGFSLTRIYVKDSNCVRATVLSL